MQDRVREQGDHNQVDERRESECEREAFHVSDSEDEENGSREEVDGVRRNDRAYRAFPACLDRRLERTAVSQLVTYSLEVDDEGVGGDTDCHDEAGHSGKGEPIALPPGEQINYKESDRRRHDERCDGHEAEGAVLQQ